MIQVGITFFDIDKTAESGQCFRWKRTGEHEYEIPAFGKVLHMKQQETPGIFELDCTEQEFDDIWKEYFDFGFDYAVIAERFRTEETPEYLVEAEKAARGIRILRQELWETIVSFIISQNNNIPKIKSSIEKICERFGGFPEAKQILEAGANGLDSLGLGYRQQYVLAAAQLYYGNGDGSTERELKSLDYKDAMQYLTRWLGIGLKVANCICLYGLGHKEAFPRDVWVKRIEEEQFGGHFPAERYEGYAGVIQQYMFYYERNRRKNGSANRTQHKA